MWYIHVIYGIYYCIYLSYVWHTFLQDCVATIPPHPHYIGPRDAQYDVAASISDPDSMWIVRPQLYFSCTLRPLNAAVDRYNNSSEDIPLDLVFFSAFEDLLLRITGTMERKGVRIDSESFMSPPPFRLSMLAGLRMLSVGFHSLHASWMAT